MVTGGSYACGDYRPGRSIGGIPEANVTLHVNYTSITKKKVCYGGGRAGEWGVDRDSPHWKPSAHNPQGGKHTFFGATLNLYCPIIINIDIFGPSKQLPSGCCAKRGREGGKEEREGGKGRTRNYYSGHSRLPGRVVRLTVFSISLKIHYSEDMYETPGRCPKSLLDWLLNVANDLTVLHAAYHVVLVGL